MKRIKAFTLIELMIAMLLSSIVFGIAYMAMRSTIAFQVNQIRLNSETSQFRTVDRLLEADFMDCDQVLQTSEKTITFTSVRKGAVMYYFNPLSVVRITDSTAVDSFHVATAADPIQLQYFDYDLKMVNGLQLTLLFHEEPVTLYYHKEYSPHIVIDKHIDSLYHDLY